MTDTSVRFRRAGRKTATVALTERARRSLARRGRLRVTLALRFVTSGSLATERSVSTTIRSPRR